MSGERAADPFDGPVRRGARRPVTVVLRALGLGDLLTGLPAVRAVRRYRPDDAVVLATTPGVAPLAVVALPDVHVVAVRELGALPVRAPVALAVNLHGHGPASTRRLRELGPEELLAYRRGGEPRWPEGVHEVARWCALVDRLRRPGCAPPDPDDLALEVDLEPRVERDRDLDATRRWSRPPADAGVRCRPRTIVHPGAAQGARRWPIGRWAAVAAAERNRGAEVLVVGSGAEAARCRAVVRWAELPPAANLAGATGVLELARLVAGADLVLAGDSGVAHLATAVATPSVVLFGPCAPAAWGPPPDRPWHRSLWSGRAGDPRADEVDPGLLDLTPADVAVAVARLVDDGFVPRPGRVEPGSSTPPADLVERARAAGPGSAPPDGRALG